MASPNDRGDGHSKDKLHWMYKGPEGHVDREEYLLGRKIDKSFELYHQGDRSSQGTSSKKFSDRGSVASSTVTSNQVDIARKVQEDPLYVIRQKEIEKRKNLLKNPVKLKKMQELLKKAAEKKEKKKKRKKQKKFQEELIDYLLIEKLKKLKDKMSYDDIMKLAADDSSDSSESSDSSDRSKHAPKRKKKKEKKKKKKKKATSSESSEESDSEPQKKQRKREGYGLIGVSTKKKFSREENNSKPRSSPVSNKSKTEDHKRDYKPQHRKKLTDEEIEQKRREMMDNAKWRDKERERNVEQYRREERKERKESEKYNKDFMRNQLSKMSSDGTVAKRIKANVNNIQRSSRAMDENFAKR